MNILYDRCNIRTMTTRLYNVVKYLQKMARDKMSGIVTSTYSEINVTEYRRGNQNGQSRETQATQDKDKQNKNTTQYVLDTTIRKQTKIM